MQGFRVAFKTCLQDRTIQYKAKNDEFHSFILAGVNDYLGTDFQKKTWRRFIHT